MGEDDGLRFKLFECANNEYLIRDCSDDKFLNKYEEVKLLNLLCEKHKAFYERADNILEFYGKRYKDSVFDEDKDTSSFRDDYWIVKHVLYNLGLIEYDE